MFERQFFTPLQCLVTVFFLSAIALTGCGSTSTPGPTPIHTDAPSPTPSQVPQPFTFTGRVCQIKSGWDVNTIFLRRAEFDALGLPIGTRVTVTVGDTGRSVEHVTLSLDSGLRVCSARLARSPRDALGVNDDTDIQPESDRPQRQFIISPLSPPANEASIDFQGRVCMIRAGQDQNTVFLRQPEFNTFGVPAGTTVSVTVLDTGQTVDNVTLGLDSDLATCSLRLSKPLRLALGVADDTDIGSPEGRPERRFSIRLPQPP